MRAVGVTKSDKDVAVVTGAAGALGTSITRALVEAGYIVVGFDSAPAVESLPHFSGDGDVIAFRGDVTDEDDLGRLVRMIDRDFGRIDLLVNNAARDTKVLPGAEAVEIDPIAEFRRFPRGDFALTLNVNVIGPFLMAQHCLELLQQSTHPSIVNISSIYGILSPNHQLYADSGVGLFKGPDYPASKAALISLSNYLAVTLSAVGIRSNAISPGGVELGQSESFVAHYSQGTPLARMASPIDVAEAVVFLGSSRSSYITGHNLVVDGGRSAW